MHIILSLLSKIIAMFALLVIIWYFSIDVMSRFKSQSIESRLKKYTKERVHQQFKETDGVWKAPFYFVHGSDPQLGLSWTNDVGHMKETIQKLNKMHPKPTFFVVTGDLCHNMQIEGGVREMQEMKIRSLFSELDPNISLVLVSGNHDMGDVPTPESVQRYRSEFGEDYFSFQVGGVFFIVLNSQYYVESKFVKDLAKEQEIWLDGQLRMLKSGDYKHAVIFQHIPWFFNSPNETEGGYFGDPSYRSISPAVRELMLDKFQNAGIRKIFCGHVHENGGGFIGDLEVVVTTAIGVPFGHDAAGIRIVKVYEKGIKHEYYALKDIPDIIEL